MKSIITKCLILVIVLAMAMAMVCCVNLPSNRDNTDNTIPNTSGDDIQISSGDNGESTSSGEDMSGNNSQTDKLYLHIGNNTLEATLVDNSTTQALLAKLKEGDIVINMNDYGNMEKVGSLGFNLPSNDEHINTSAGDLIIYQGNNFVIYYDTNAWSLTRIGKIQGLSASQLKNILGNGNVRVTLSLTK